MCSTQGLQLAFYCPTLCCRTINKWILRCTDAGLWEKVALIRFLVFIFTSFLIQECVSTNYQRPFSPMVHPHRCFRLCDSLDFLLGLCGCSYLLVWYKGDFTKNVNVGCCSKSVALVLCSRLLSGISSCLSASSSSVMPLCSIHEAENQDCWIEDWTLQWFNTDSWDTIVFKK